MDLFGFASVDTLPFLASCTLISYKNLDKPLYAFASLTA